MHPSESGAVAAASAAVLAGVYAAETTFVREQLDADAAYFAAQPPERHQDYAAGQAIGRAVAAQVLAYAAGDRNTVPWNGDRLTGAGHWSPVSLPPQDATWGGIRPWLMSSPDQFHPGPPPAITSSVFATDLAEVRAISATRTSEQATIARYWASGYGAGGPAGFFGSEAVRLASAQDMGERETARVLAVLHMAVMDASIGCYEAKYRYWYLRPYEADRAITVPTGVSVPNFPSYPSAHSCLSAAAAAVLAAYFPSEASALEGKVQEAGLSRIYAGLHFRFEITAGQRLGNAVAALALRLAPKGQEPIALD